MKAIETKYFGATNSRGARVVASDSDNNRVSISYPHELTGEAVHRAAADALCKKMGWTGTLAGGSTKRGYTFVFVEQPETPARVASLLDSWTLAQLKERASLNRLRGIAVSKDLSDEIARRENEGRL